LSARTDLYFAYRFEQRQFLPGPLITSHIGTIGWSRLLTPSLRLVLEGGPRVSDGDWSPDVTITATQTVNDLTTFSMGYGHTQDVAVGVIGLITTDRVNASVTMARTRRWEAMFSAGAFRNVQPVNDSLAYDASVSVGRSLSDAIWLVASVNRTFNDQRFRGAPVPNTQIIRNWVLISIRVQPFRPR